MNSKNHVLCIYHDHCADGLAAAWVVKDACKNIICNTVAMSYGQAVEEVAIAAAGIVYIVDFSIGAGKLLDLADRYPQVSFKWIDHHKTAIQEWNDTLKARGINRPPHNLDTFLSWDNTIAGSLLTWNYMHHDIAPWWIQCISDRDLWKFESPSSKPLHAWLVHRGMTFNTLDILATVPWDGVERAAIIHEGELLLAHFLRLCHEIIGCSKETIVINGITGLCCNAPPMFASDIGNILAKESDTFAAIWYSPHAGQANFSLRSEGTKCDVSVLAKQFSGGGHKNAAGFVIKDQVVCEEGRSVWSTDNGRHSDVSTGDTGLTAGDTKTSSDLNGDVEHPTC